MNARFPTWLLAGLPLVLVGAWLTWQSLPSGPAPAIAPDQPRLSSGTYLDDKDPLPAFAAARHGGDFGNEDLKGRWSYIFFGYTQCPDVCPTSLGLLKEVKSRVVAKELPVPQVVMISVDPVRDSPEVLRGYVEYYDADFIGATADDEALAPLFKNLGVFVSRHDADDAGDYSVDHTATIYLIDPRGHLKAVFSAPQNAALMADDYEMLVR